MISEDYEPTTRTHTHTHTLTHEVITPAAVLVKMKLFIPLTVTESTTRVTTYLGVEQEHNHTRSSTIQYNN